MLVRRVVLSLAGVSMGRSWSQWQTSIWCVFFVSLAETTPEQPLQAVDHDATMDENFDGPSLQGLDTHSKSTSPSASHRPDQASSTSDQHSALSSTSRLSYTHSINMASAYSADALPELVSTSPPLPSLAPMSISPESSFVQLPQSQRKLRFTMGPRSDCEKCRLGVKGHWMHLD